MVMGTGSSAFNYLLGDHLGLQAITINQSVFNQVYTNVDKIAAPTAAGTETFLQAAGSFLSSAEILFTGIFFYVPSPL